MEVDTFSHRAVSVGPVQAPGDGQGWSGGVERHLHKPGPQTHSVRHVELLFLNYLVKRQ